MAIFTPTANGDTITPAMFNDGYKAIAEISPAPGRLTLETGVPISTSDQSAKATLYYTLTGRHGNKVRLYNTTSTIWEAFAMSADLSLSLAALTASTAYDIYVYSNSGTLTLEAAAWSGSTPPTRAIQNGWYVANADKSRLLLGSVYINSSGGQTDDAKAKRFVYNLYNQNLRLLYQHDSTASWTTTNNAYETWNGSTANRVEFLCGLASDKIYMHFLGMSSYSGANTAMNVGIGLDSTTSTSATSYGHTNAAANTTVTNNAIYNDSPGIGYHYAQMTQRGAGATTTFYGFTSGVRKSALIGRILS